MLAQTYGTLWLLMFTPIPRKPLVGDPGCILHEGAGTVQLLMVAVNWGPGDAGVYAGPVMSHYEFALSHPTRKTDSQWKSELRGGTAPQTPEMDTQLLGPRDVHVPLVYLLTT